MNTDTAQTEEEIGDVLCRLDRTHSDEAVMEAVRSMEDVQQYSLLRSLRELEQNVTGQ
jgi:hypothetical protein